MINNLSILELFKGYIGNDSGKYSEIGFKYGLIIPEDAPSDVLDAAIKLYGKDGEKWNNTFHKSWKTVKDTPIEILIAEQILHYFTTYGFEDLGIFDHDLVYIPHEKLEVPELSENIELVVIHPYTKEQVTEKLMTLLTSGIALNAKTIDNIKNLSDLIDKERFDDVKNREMRIYLYDTYNIMPKDADNFLRYVLYKLTGTTLKINNDINISAIQRMASIQSNLVEDMFNKYLKQDRGFEKLASIFLRNKDFFIALKCNKKMCNVINRLRKGAKKYHRPMPLNILDRLTDPAVEAPLNLEEMLDNIPVFREMRIINGLRYRLTNNTDYVYTIRNGRSFTTNSKSRLTYKNLNLLQKRHDRIYAHLISRLKDKFAGKHVCIPDNITYMVPTSEKQFVSMIPSGSFIELERNEDLIFGIHWMNLAKKSGEERIDLDLHMTGENSSFGWNTRYRSEGGEVLFSGDLTDAPRAKGGASELYFVAKEVSENFTISLNNFTANDAEVPFEFVVAKTNAADRQKFIDESYVLDPNDIILQVNLSIDPEGYQKNIGTILIDDNHIKITFNNIIVSNSIVSDKDELAQARLNYAQTFADVQLQLRDLLVDAGAKVSNRNKKAYRKLILENMTVEEYRMTDRIRNYDEVVTTTTEDGNKRVITETTAIPVDFDLSLNSLTKDTFIKMFE